jgi:copper transport protein
VLLTVRAAVSRNGRWWHGLVMGVATLALAVVYAQSSHGTNQSGFDVAQVAFRIVHLVAAGVWVGGLTVLAVLLAVPLRRGTLRGAVAVAAFRRYGALAVLAVGALTASGLVLAGAGIASPEALITTTYGWTLIAKVIAVAVVMVIGLRHSRLDGLPPIRSLAYEVGAMLIVLWGAAALAATAPAPVQTAQAAPSVPVSAPILGTDTTKLIDDLTIRTSMAPGHPGHNTLFIQLHGDASVPFRSITDVRVTLSQPGAPPRTSSGTFIGRGRYTFTQVTIANTGQLSVRVAIVRQPGPDAIAQFAWPITPAPPAYVPLSLPTTPWAPGLDVLAGAIGLVVVVWRLAGLVRDRRRRGSPAAAA